MKKVWNWLKGETVLLIALIAALISMLFIPPDAAYAAYVDWDVLMLLFSLMAVVAGLKRCGVMDRLSAALLRRAGNARMLCLLLSMACFFSSMLVTNDVALITFVPLTTALLQGEALILTVVLETIAANLGSMATPIGNPQNLYLYAHYNMPIAAFLRAVVPLTLVSLVLLVLACLLMKRTPVAMPVQKVVSLSQKSLWLHAVQFMVCLLAVMKVLPKWAAFALMLISTALYDRSLLKEVDYALLATFVCFFLFVGNLGRIPAVSTLLGGVVAERELEVGILASQVISNVPAALMLSGFTQNAPALMRGVDIGGLGTIIASLASLISFKIYMKTPGAKAGRYMAVFTLWNVGFLAVLYVLARIGV